MAKPKKGFKFCTQLLPELGNAIFRFSQFILSRKKTTTVLNSVQLSRPGAQNIRQDFLFKICYRMLQKHCFEVFYDFSKRTLHFFRKTVIQIFGVKIETRSNNTKCLFLHVETAFHRTFR